MTRMDCLLALGVTFAASSCGGSDKIRLDFGDLDDSSGGSHERRDFNNPGQPSSGGVSNPGGSTGVDGAGGESSGGNSGSGASGGDTGSGPPQEILACGDNVSCPKGALSACCWDAYYLHGDPRGQCVTGDEANDGCATELSEAGLETRIECQGPAQCPGQVCCGERMLLQGTSSAYYERVVCKDSCDYPDVILCSPNDDLVTCPSKWKDGGKAPGECVVSQLLPSGYFVCADN